MLGSFLSENGKCKFTHDESLWWYPMDGFIYDQFHRARLIPEKFKDRGNYFLERGILTQLWNPEATVDHSYGWFGAKGHNVNRSNFRGTPKGGQPYKGPAQWTGAPNIASLE